MDITTVLPRDSGTLYMLYYCQRHRYWFQRFPRAQVVLLLAHALVLSYICVYPPCLVHAFVRPSCAPDASNNCIATEHVSTLLKRWDLTKQTILRNTSASHRQGVHQGAWSVIIYICLKRVSTSCSPVLCRLASLWTVIAILPCVDAMKIKVTRVITMLFLGIRCHAISSFFYY